jgi:hypothetical protein
MATEGVSVNREASVCPTCNQRVVQRVMGSLLPLKSLVTWAPLAVALEPWEHLDRLNS